MWIPFVIQIEGEYGWLRGQPGCDQRIPVSTAGHVSPQLLAWSRCVRESSGRASRRGRLCRACGHGRSRSDDLMASILGTAGSEIKKWLEILGNGFDLCGKASRSVPTGTASFSKPKSTSPDGGGQPDEAFDSEQVAGDQRRGRLSHLGHHGRVLWAHVLLDFQCVAVAGRRQRGRYGRFVLVVSDHGLRHGHRGHGEDLLGRRDGLPTIRPERTGLLETGPSSCSARPST